MALTQTQRNTRVLAEKGPSVTFIWFVVWLIANNVGAHKPLLLNPVNVWTGALILAIALDLGAANATGTSRRRP